MSASKISRFLPNNEYLAAVNASAPTAVNPFATIADIPAITTPTLQSVLTAGSTYTGSATININTTDGIDMFAGDAGLLLSASGYFVLAYGSGTTAGISMGPALGIDGVQVRDETASSGMYYLAPYSAQGIILHGDRWIPDAGWVNSQIALVSDLNGIYTGSGTTALNTEVTVGNDLVFIGATDTNVQSVRFQNASNTHSFIIQNGGNVYNTGKLFSAQIGTTGAIFGSGRVFEIKGTGANVGIFVASTGVSTITYSTIGANDFAMTMTDSAGDSNVLLRSSGTSYFLDNIIIGGTTATAGTKLHTQGGDVKFEGLTDANLFFADHSLDSIGIGTVASANAKVTVSGDVETVVAGDGLIVLDASNGTRYRIYMDGGVLSSQLA